MKTKSITTLLCLIPLMLSSCGAKKPDFTRIRPEFQEEVSSRVESVLKMAQSEEVGCTHNYTDYGVQSPDIEKYSDEEHMLICPLCKETLSYEPHNEQLSSVIENVAALKNGEQCDVRYSICECGAFYKALLYIHGGGQ